MTKQQTVGANGKPNTQGDIFLNTWGKPFGGIRTAQTIAQIEYGIGINVNKYALDPVSSGVIPIWR
jgi:hypothetical protein